MLAVTDHDSVMGVAAAQAAGMKADVQILPAIEFSTAGEHDRDFLDINIRVRHRPDRPDRYWRCWTE